MNVRNIILPIIIFCLANMGCEVRAANVIWCNTKLDEALIVSYPYDRTYFTTPNYPQLQMNAICSGLSLILSGVPESNLAYATSFTVTSSGDEITRQYFENQSSYFTYARVSGEEQSGYSITMNPGDSVYLAFFIEYSSSPDEWQLGWLQLSLSSDGLLTMPYVAMMDEGPLIVGGGAIPEPSGGLLFLLGGAALALWRRRRTPIEAAFAVLSEWERMSVRDRSRKL
ncbi:MAG: PEP-CTERM sorting domain-containing protein [Kiritimatiellae bacterium]|nr:PEP-CTERM sorting domain-containing protein [Kiritimatiellia bacterium]